MKKRRPDAERALDQERGRQGCVHDCVVNKSLSFVPSDARYWDANVSKRRWVSLYKSFKEAMLLESKGNSTAGCTLEEIQNSATSLLAKQKLKCASFEVLPCHAACEWCTCGVSNMDQYRNPVLNPSHRLMTQNISQGRAMTQLSQRADP